MTTRPWPVIHGNATSAENAGDGLLQVDGIDRIGAGAVRTTTTTGSISSHLTHPRRTTRDQAVKALGSVVPLTMSFAILAGCTSTGSQTAQSAAVATSSPSSASAAAGSSVTGAVIPLSTSAQPAEVQSYIAALAANQDAALQQVEPGTGAYLFTQSLIFTNRSRGRSVTFVETPDGYMTSGFLLSDFQVDSGGKIATFQRNHVPVDLVYVPGDGKTYQSPDGAVSVMVQSFRHFDINGDGNTSVVYRISNTGSTDATLSTDKYTAGGVDYPINDVDDVPAGEVLTLPTALGKVPQGARLSLTLTTSGSDTKTPIELDVPALG